MSACLRKISQGSLTHMQIWIRKILILPSAELDFFHLMTSVVIIQVC